MRREIISRFSDPNPELGQARQDLLEATRLNRTFTYQWTGPDAALGELGRLVGMWHRGFDFNNTGFIDNAWMILALQGIEHLTQKDYYSSVFDRLIRFARENRRPRRVALTEVTISEIGDQPLNVYKDIFEYHQEGHADAISTGGTNGYLDVLGDLEIPGLPLAKYTELIKDGKGTTRETDRNAVYSLPTRVEGVSLEVVQSKMPDEF